MTFRWTPCFAIGAALLLASCGGSSDLPLMAGQAEQVISAGDAMYQEAKQLDEAGKTRSALRLYKQVAVRYPLAPMAAQARYRRAQIYEEKGDLLKAFDEYQELLINFQGSSLYSQAMARQEQIAFSAADGGLKDGLFWKTRIPRERTIRMLGQVRDNAPKTRVAAKAQFTIGEIYQQQKKAKEAKEAIATFQQLVKDQPNSPEAPEGLFRVGLIHIEEAERGNQNQANLDLAREAFLDYLLQYPGHARNAEANQLLASLNKQDLQRSFEIAEFYRKTEKYESAKVYYRDVAKRAKSGELYDKATARLKELGE